MKSIMKLGVLAAMVAVIALAVGVPLAMAWDDPAGDEIETGDFHSAGKLQCNKCHTMHYSENGTTPTELSGFGMDADTGGPFPHLLLKENTTELCLACHDDPLISPDVYNATVELPGGDFAPAGSFAEANAHNPTGTVGNASTLIPIDSELGLTPPGGTGALSRWTCCECHDEHGDTGQAFMYRNLLKNVGGVDVSGTLMVAGPAELGDTEEAQIWDGSSVNVTAEADINHNAYLVETNEDDDIGFGAWCGGCHGAFHGVDDNDTHDGSAWIRHPTNTLLTSDMETAYGALTGFIPVETTRAAFTYSTDLSGLTADETTDQVSCLSCHRAHAAEKNAVRWDSAIPAGDNANCNKCHDKGA